MAAIDKFQNEKKTYEMPSNHLFSITPDDVLEQPYITRAIYIGTAGDLTVTDEFNNTVTFFNLVPGILLPLRVKLVKVTGTSAGALIGLI